MSFQLLPLFQIYNRDNVWNRYTLYGDSNALMLRIMRCDTRYIGWMFGNSFCRWEEENNKGWEMGLFSFFHIMAFGFLYCDDA